MIGLVNSVGTAETSRTQAVRDSAVRNQIEDQQHKILPILNNEEAAQRILRTAINTIGLTDATAERNLPGGGQSDRFDQAELEGTATGTLGQNLDVTA